MMEAVLRRLCKRRRPGHADDRGDVTSGVRGGRADVRAQVEPACERPLAAEGNAGIFSRRVDLLSDFEPRAAGSSLTTDEPSRGAGHADNVPSDPRALSVVVVGTSVLRPREIEL